MAEMTRKDLIRAAKELNKVLGLEPAIDVKEDDEDLKKHIKEAGGIVEPEDDITPATTKVLEVLSQGTEFEEEEEEEEIVSEEKPEKPAKKKENKSGVLATIAGIIEDSGEQGVTKGEILEKLISLFPDRKAESMKKTINTQVPSRISKERFNIERDKTTGRYKKV